MARHLDGTTDEELASTSAVHRESPFYHVESITTKFVYMLAVFFCIGGALKMI